jgi:hypothetical protein
MDALPENIGRKVPWDMLYADDLIIADDSATNAQISFTGWQRALESNGLKINTSKTEVMVCSRTDEELVVLDGGGTVLKQVETFK